MAHRYEIYGVVLASELALQAPAVTDKAPDISIVLADVAANPPEALELTAAYAAISESQFWLDIPDVARFFAPDLNTIHVQPYLNSDSESVELYLLGAVLGPLLNMRKQLVMHGNVVHVDLAGKAFRLLLCGHSAAGKSSFSAYLLKHHNARLVADDLAVFNGKGHICSGSPRLKVWQDVAHVLALSETELTPVRPSVAKFDWHVGAQFSSELAPVDVVVLLASENGDGVEIEELQGAKKLQPLQKQIFRGQLANKAGLEQLHFMLLAKYLGKTPVVRLGRPRSNKIQQNLQTMSEVLFAHLGAESVEALNDE